MLGARPEPAAPVDQCLSSTSGAWWAMAQNSRVGAEAPGWYRIELILITELFEGWQLFVDGTVIVSCGRLEASAAKAWADVALGRQVTWFPGRQVAWFPGRQRGGP